MYSHFVPCFIQKIAARLRYTNSFPHGFRAEVLNDKQFAQLMAALHIEEPSNEALAHLKVPQHGGGRRATVEASPFWKDVILVVVSPWNMIKHVGFYGVSPFWKGPRDRSVGY